MLLADKIAHFLKACRLTLSACLLFSVLPAGALATQLDKLTNAKSAIEMGMYKTPQWLALLHYKKQGDGWKSRISDPLFYLAQDGRYNPQSELTKMVLGMFDSSDPNFDIVACRFPARAEWILKYLRISDEKFKCEENRILLEQINPKRAVIVFPAPRTRGVGAMFGHTLLRFDADGRSPLLSYSINYAAHTERAGFSKVVWKGLTGGFYGRFSFMPYYRKLKEYREMEERDVWEYPLDLTADEVRMMVLHAIELRDVSSEYYFLDENCALLMLALIDVARPSIALVEHYANRSAFWVVPSDTIQNLWSAGIAKQPLYKPSIATKLNFISAKTNPKIVRFAIDLLDHDSSVLLDNFTQDEIKIANAIAALALQYRFSRLELHQEEFMTKFSKLANEGQLSTDEDTPLPFPPHEGHSAGRFQIGAGYANESSFIEIGLRPAYHNKDDHPIGYPSGAELEFLNLRGRYLPNKNSIRLQEATLFKIASLMPYNPFTTSTSWQFNIGASRHYLHDGVDHLLLDISIGTGISGKSDPFGLLYCMLTGSLIAGKGLSKNFDVAPGIEVGFIKQLSDNLQSSASLSMNYFGVSENEIVTRLNGGMSYKVSRNSAVKISEVVELQGVEKYYLEGSIQWLQYF